MKKIGLSILLSANLLLALDLSGVFFKNADTLGKSHGGQNYDIDAYSDGVGVFVKSVTPEASVNFEKFNKSVLKRGSEAKSNGISVTGLIGENIEGVVRGFVDPKQQEKAKRLAAIPDELKNYTFTQPHPSFNEISVNRHTTKSFNGNPYKFILQEIRPQSSGAFGTTTITALSYNNHEKGWHGRNNNFLSGIYISIHATENGITKLYFNEGAYSSYAMYVPADLLQGKTLDVLFKDKYGKYFRVNLLSEEHPKIDSIPLFIDYSK